MHADNLGQAQAENLLLDLNPDTSAEALVDQWVVPEKPPVSVDVSPDANFVENCGGGYYCNIIWPTRTSLGCGRAVNSNGLYFFCRLAD